MIAKVKRVLGIAAAAAILGMTGSAMAAPFLSISLEGRKAGSGDAFSKTLLVQQGDVIEYRLLADVAPEGTTNTQGTTVRTITSLTVGTDGVNSIPRFDIFQATDAGIQVDFGTDAALTQDPSSVANDSWSAGTNTSSGTPTERSAGFDDLAGVRAAHQAGVFTGVNPETVLTGTFTVGRVDGLAGSLNIRNSTPFVAGGMRINGATSVAITSGSEGGADPFINYSGLQLNAVPEPGSLAFAGLAAMALFSRRRRNA